MQHSKAHPALIRAAATAAILAISAAGVLVSSFAAHADTATPPSVAQPLNSPSPVPVPGTAGTPQNSPSAPVPGSAANPTNPANPTANPSQSNTIANPLKYNTLNDLLSAVLQAAIQLGTIVLTIALVWVGFLFVAARGNDEKISRARSALLWTIIGGLILLGATAIQAVITSTVGSITS